MKSIENIKNQFNTPEAFAVFSDCMYMPTWENFKKRAGEYMNSATISIFGYLDNKHIVGIIIIDKRQDRASEIRGISVHSDYRNRGIGKQLVQYACDELVITDLYAETDDDAVKFYEHCGFQTKAFLKEGENGNYRRYKCVLHINCMLSEGIINYVT